MFAVKYTIVCIIILISKRVPNLRRIIIFAIYMYICGNEIHDYSQEGVVSGQNYFQ